MYFVNGDLYFFIVLATDNPFCAYTDIVNNQYQIHVRERGSDCMADTAAGYFKRLESIVRELEDVESEYYNLQSQLSQMKLQLTSKEASLLNEGMIDGKNEQLRNAQIFDYTADLQMKINELESGLNARKAKMNAKRRGFEVLQYYVRLLEALNSQRR